MEKKDTASLTSAPIKERERSACGEKKKISPSQLGQGEVHRRKKIFKGKKRKVGRSVFK